MAISSEMAAERFESGEIDRESHNLAQYSGWGVDPTHRNVGDELCHSGLLELLEYQGINPADVFSPRNSRDPHTEPWSGKLLIGGGTVIPGVFKDTICPGLKQASDIVIFGSGCLSPEEMRNRGFSIEGYRHFARAEVIGVRGPLSAQYFQHYFKKPVDFIGDLAFMGARETPLPVDSTQVTLFLIEHPMKGSRLAGSSKQILGMFRDLIGSDAFRDYFSAICLTDAEPPIAKLGRAGTWVDVVEHAMLPEHLAEVVSRSKIVLTERLHPAIMAACLGVPFLYLQTTSKSRDLELLMKHHGSGTAIGDCFVNLVDGNSLPDDRLGRVLGNSELPHQLVHVSGAIKRTLISASGSLVQALKAG